VCLWGGGGGGLGGVSLYAVEAKVVELFFLYFINIKYFCFCILYSGGRVSV